MTEYFTDLEFAKPFFLWLLLALPILWLRVRDRRLPVLIARTAILTLLILTVADPQAISERSAQEERIFAYDVSRSIAPSMRRWMESATQKLVPKADDRFYIFAAEAKQVADLGAAMDAATAQSTARSDKTNLEALVNSLLALPAAPRSLFLFTDGWETQGNIERLLPAAAAAGLKIYPMLPAQPPAIANVAVTKLLIPSQGNSGESLTLKVVVKNQNDRETQGNLTLQRNGQPFKTDLVKLSPGTQTFTYPITLTDGALTSYQATFTPREPAADGYSADNHAVAWVTVRSKAKVLIISGQTNGSRYLEEIVKRHGFEATASAPENAPPPNDFKIVVFNNAERDRFGANYLATVERHVAAGNGFIMLGAEASFAPSSYRQTPIEKLLPVEPKEPPKKEEKNRAVVLVIDKSGSMRDENRILYAKEAAKAVARQLKDIDLLGVVGFDDSPFVVVYLESMARLRGIIDSQIDRLKPGGQTYFLPALIEAKRQLERANASYKHLILLSDGVTRGSQGELVDLVGLMKNQLKITVSTVAISNEADVRIMKRISQYGGGLFHHTTDPRSLPQIVLDQLQEKPREEPPENKPLIPVVSPGSELLNGFTGKIYPPVLGYMETELKRGAQLDLAIARDDRRAPLLASWRYGGGKSVALTMDFEARWSRNWIPWNSLQGFWDKVLDWLSPTEDVVIPAHQAHVSFAQNRSILDLAVYEEIGVNSRFGYSINGRGTKLDGHLDKLAPGHYQAVLPLSTPGDYRIDLTEERAGRRIAYPPIGYSLTYDLTKEFPRDEFNTGLLIQVAQATGGEVNPQLLDRRVSAKTKSAEPAKSPLLMLMIALCLIEFCARKFVFNEPD